MNQPAIIVPYRDRARNLSLWLEYMAKLPQMQRIRPSIHVIHQATGEMFNKGRLHNIGFFLAGDCDYYLFHDVDLLPVHADFSYPDRPAHLSARTSQFRYRPPYGGLFGGVVAFNSDDYLRVNGYSNQYFDWGGEDDDIRIRCERTGLAIDWRDGIYYSLRHPLNYGGVKPNHQRNIARLRENRSRADRHEEDGLANLTFTELGRERPVPDFPFELTLHHVHFNNHDLDTRAHRPAGYLKPNVSDDVEIERTHSGITLKHADGAVVGELNEVASQLIRLCDGTCSIDTMTHALSQHYLEHIYEIERDVPEIVGRFEQLKVCSYRSPFALEFMPPGQVVGARTITVTVHNRPDNLSQLLASLSRNDLTGYQIIFALEPGFEQTRILCEQFPHPFKTILYNPVKLGVRSNPYSVLDYVFNNGSQCNIYLEDDLELAIDAVDLANWYFEQTFTGEILALALHGFNARINEEDLDKLIRGTGFSALGLAMKKQHWDCWFKPHWFNDDHCLSSHGKGWDFSMNAVLQEHPELCMLYPVCARSRHTGRIGTHSTAEFHDRVLAKTVVNNITRIRRFVVDHGIDNADSVP